MMDKNKIITKNFNFEVNDRVVVFKGAPMYRKNSFHPEKLQGTIAHISANTDVESSNCPLYIVWDNNVLSANCLQNIRLVEEEALKDRCVYDTTKLFFENIIPATAEDVLPTLYSRTYGSAVSTYYKNDFGKMLHCVENKLRSFDDIYYLFKSYFPEETFKSVFRRMLLYNISYDQMIAGTTNVQLANCSTINRIRYVPNNSKISFTNLFDTAVESSTYNSIISWRSLFRLLNVNSGYDLRVWYTNEAEKLKPTLKPKLKTTA